MDARSRVASLLGQTHDEYGYQISTMYANTNSENIKVQKFILDNFFGEVSNVLVSIFCLCKVFIKYFNIKLNTIYITIEL